jgi:hypothetical protein
MRYEMITLPKIANLFKWVFKMQYEGVLKKNANQFGINSILFGFMMLFERKSVIR